MVGWGVGRGDLPVSKPFLCLLPWGVNAPIAWDDLNEIDLTFCSVDRGTRVRAQDRQPLGQRAKFVHRSLHIICVSMAGQFNKEHVLVLGFRRGKRLDPREVQVLLFENCHGVSKCTRFMAHLKKNGGLVIARWCWMLSTEDCEPG